MSAQMTREEAEAEVDRFNATMVQEKVPACATWGQNAMVTYVAADGEWQWTGFYPAYDIKTVEDLRQTLRRALDRVRKGPHGLGCQ